jgi:hypothetical protein
MNYPDSDFPYTMFFCGEPMPKWAAQWHWISPAEHRSDPELWHVLFWHLLCRIDHVGGVESEDATVFRLSAQYLLASILADQGVARARLESAPGLSAGDVDAVLAGITEGLARMIVIARRRSVVAWMSGYVTDRDRLLASMARMELPPDHPDYMQPPHVVTREAEFKCECDIQVRRLHHFAQGGQLTKHMRAMLYQIKGPNQQVQPIAGKPGSD